MAIIYTYPVKTNPANDDLILISDSADSNKTKQIKVSSLPSSGGGSVSSVGLSLNSLAAFAISGDNPVTGSGTITLGVTGGSTGQYLDYQGNWSTPSGSGPSTAMTTTTLGLGKIRYATGSTPAAETQSTTASRTYGITANSSDQLVVNVPWTDTSGISFSGTTAGGVAIYSNATTADVSADLTFSSNTLNVKHTVDIKGQGQNLPQAQLKLNCEMNSHAVTIKGPVHNNSGGSYILQLPSLVPANNQILEFTSSGNLGWINTPTGSGISFSGSTANGIATYSSATQANVSSAFTVSGNKLSAPAGTLADPSIEVGTVGGLYAASGGITLAHNGADGVGVNSSSIVNYKLTQFQAGLKFGSTGETLNSYEEGTWTPTSANANTISSAVGDYTRVGDMVFAQFSFTMTGSTTVAIAGLPFQGVYTSALKGGAIISKNTCLSVQGQLVGGEFTGTNTFTFNSYNGSGTYNPNNPSVAALPYSLYTTTSSLYQTAGGTYAGIIIYETTE